MAGWVAMQEEEGGGREFICTARQQAGPAPEKEGMESAGGNGGRTWFRGEMKRNPCVALGAIM